MLASTPRPATARRSFAGATGTDSRCAASSTALASGCVEPRCTAAARRIASSRAMSSGTTSTSEGLPSVSVPVLSKTTTRVRWAISRASASLMRMPWRAATPVPTMTAVGVASPRAHGQAMTRTATALRMPASQLPVPKPQAASVTSATATTAGTNTSLTRSTMRWMGALAACADSTARMILASVPSAPTATVRATRRPSMFTDPPVIRPPGALLTGSPSPVTSDSSTWLVPSVTSASTGTRSPGSTTTRSPTAHPRDRHDALDARLHAPRRLGAQRRQGPDGLRRLALGALLEPLARAHQRDHDRRSLEIEVRALPGERQVHAQAVGRAGADRHEEIHVARARGERLPRGAIEPGADHELHGGGEEQLQPRRQHPVRRRRGRPPWARRAAR